MTKKKLPTEKDITTLIGEDKHHNIDIVRLQHLIKRGGVTIIKKGNKYYKVKELG